MNIEKSNWRNVIMNHMILFSGLDCRVGAVLLIYFLNIEKKSINVGQIMSFCIFGWNKGISNLQIYPMALCYNCQFQKQEKIFFLNLYNIFAQFEFFVFQLNRWAHSYFLAAAVFCHIVLNSFLFLILANAVQIFCI